MVGVNNTNMELLQVAEAVSREKGIPKETILHVLESALESVARKKYGSEYELKVEISRKNGEIAIYRAMLIVETEDELSNNLKNSILLSDAKTKHADASVGDTIYEQLPLIDFGRITAQSTKHVINSTIRDIEREIEHKEFEDRIGDVMTGVVEKVESGHVIMKIGSAEAIIRRDQLLKADQYKKGDRIKGYFVEIDPRSFGPQLVFSRTHDMFLAKLFAQEVPEIYDGIIQIKRVARDPGSKAKIAVFSQDLGIDAVGSCVGIRGGRVQAVTAELKGEKIDIVQWSSDPATFVINALTPAKITKVIIDEDSRKIEVVVPEDQQSIAIGRRGQNVRLASQLISWNIDILTEDLESSRRKEEFGSVTQKFMDALDLDELLAQLLASEGFSSIEEIANISVTDLANVQALDENIANELIDRAKKHLQIQMEQAQNNELFKIKRLTHTLIEYLNSNGITKIQDLADLSRDEFLELLNGKHKVKNSEVDEIIMDARNHIYFKDE